MKSSISETHIGDPHNMVTHLTYSVKHFPVQKTGAHAHPGGVGRTGLAVAVGEQVSGSRVLLHHSSQDRELVEGHRDSGTIILFGDDEVFTGHAKPGGVHVELVVGAPRWIE
jgi:hypothetical protein